MEKDSEQYSSPAQVPELGRDYGDAADGVNDDGSNEERMKFVLHHDTTIYLNSINYTLQLLHLGKKGKASRKNNFSGSQDHSEN